ncbi:glycosyltransferase family 4 protein [Pseudoalteromonas sp. G4]|uniref:glycosyltransferase family 4 protein n=1 Tax=Pseudoalteromonas sp. G4 TaxID=2992761 RepID=UPI00237E2E5A|nr:glycosyltransferase family 4 protein [Pseudoalteromonas sp. G4]MDE3270649.1 glycosyltransferase family 4 protein [Pseudoalteromonas sp. G4]
MTILYVVNQYPKISHTFIRREILEMEKQGESILRSSIRRPPEKLIDQTDIIEQSKTHYILNKRFDLLIYFLKGLATKNFFSTFRFFVSYLNQSRRKVKPILYFIEAICLAGRFKAEKLKHIHAHFGTNSADVAMFSSKLLNVGFSFTIHGADELDNFEEYSIRQKVNQAEKTFCICSYLAAQVKRKTDLFVHNKLVVNKCGVEDVDNLNKKTSRKRNQDIVELVIVARACPEKGYFTLLEALNYIKSQSQCNFHLSVVGGGDDLQQVKTKAKEFGLLENISFLGWKTSQEVFDLVGQSDLFVLPSYMEGLPISIMEAMLVETPVLSTYVAGIPELIENGKNGMLVPANEHIPLAKAICDFALLSDVERDELTRLARNSVLMHHDLSLVVKEKRKGFRSGY